MIRIKECYFFILFIGKTVALDVVVVVLVVVAMVDECRILFEDFVFTKIELYTLLW